MSNALAIAAVSGVLRELLNSGLIKAAISDSTGGDVNVTALPPDRILSPGGSEPNQLNLFLYQVTYNSGWRNRNLPARNSAGERISNPVLALDLHYLLTAYGARELNAEMILGHAMQVLHETPILTHEGIRQALADTQQNFPAQLATAGLAEQIENLRIAPENMNTEETFRIWSSLQTHYRPTAAYQISVVLIESARSHKAALPVSGVQPAEHPGRNVYLLPFHQPLIERIVAAAGENAAITAGSTLLIQGQRLYAERVEVFSGSIDLSASVKQASETKITVELADPLPAGLYAGVLPLQVVHPLLLGTPETEHRGVESNVSPFVLSPKITVALVGTPQDDDKVDDFTAKKGQLKVSFNPPVNQRQRVLLLLNQFNDPVKEKTYAYSFSAPKDNGVPEGASAADEVTFTFNKVVAGDYLVRVRVDGAESLLELDSNTKRYNAPLVSI